MTDSQIKKAAYKLIKSQDSVALRELVGDLLKRLEDKEAVIRLLTEALDDATKRLKAFL